MHLVYNCDYSCVVSLVCVQEVAELWEEHLSSYTDVTTNLPVVATAELPTHILAAMAATEPLIVSAPEGQTEIPTPASVNTVDTPVWTGLTTPASGVSGDLSRILCETHSNEGDISNYVDNLFFINNYYSQVLMTCVMC